MDPEGRQGVPLLSPHPDSFDSVKVFPYIVHLKRDIIVSAPGHVDHVFLSHLFLYPVAEKLRSVLSSLNARRHPYMVIQQTQPSVGSKSPRP